MPLASSVIGDSTMAALAWYPYDNDDPDPLNNNDIREIIGNTYHLMFSAESCRRWSTRAAVEGSVTRRASTLPLMRGDLPRSAR